MANWTGEPPEKCDLCEEQLEETFIDGVVQGRGWAVMCPRCHKEKGIGLGMGCGQQFDARTGVKLAG